MNVEDYNVLFDNVIEKYHVLDTVEQPFENPYQTEATLPYLLYEKCWIDTLQWHYEDIIRLPNIDLKEALELKRKIDASNQKRTEIVERIDDYFLDKYKGVKVKKDAKINTESPAWAIDRLSILALKIYHMRQESSRENTAEEHRKKCTRKLNILSEQRTDLTKAIEQLIKDIESGYKYMKVYKQMKMYNDDDLNPVLYNNKN